MLPVAKTQTNTIHAVFVAEELLGRLNTPSNMTEEICAEEDYSMHSSTKLGLPTKTNRGCWET